MTSILRMEDLNEMGLAIHPDHRDSQGYSLTLEQRVFHGPCSQGLSHVAAYPIFPSGQNDTHWPC